jgi:hypothetical protein
VFASAVFYLFPHINSVNKGMQVKFIYSEKATKFCEIFPLLLTQYIQSKVRGRFCKSLWPSQNIWTLIVNKVRLLISKKGHVKKFRVTGCQGQRKVKISLNAQIENPILYWLLMITCISQLQLQIIPAVWFLCHIR